MTGIIDGGLEFYRDALALRAYRQQILSADIANASTPGFKAVDLDFSGALSAALGRRTGGDAPTASPKRVWLVDDVRQIGAGAPADTAATAATADAPASASAFVKYQAGSEVTLDGNSVDLDQEKVTAAENSVQYEAVATFATQTVRLLTMAIAGSGSQQSAGG